MPFKTVVIPGETDAVFQYINALDALYRDEVWNASVQAAAGLAFVKLVARTEPGSRLRKAVIPGASFIEDRYSDLVIKTHVHDVLNELSRAAIDLED